MSFSKDSKMSKSQLKKEEGTKILNQFMLQRYRNSFFEDKKEISPNREKVLAMAFGSSVRISHQEESGSQFTLNGKQFSNKKPVGNRSNSFSDTFKQKAWRDTYSSHNGSEIAQSSAFRLADTPLK